MVNRVIKWYAIFDTVTNRSGRGQHKKLSERDQRHILNNLKKNQRSTLRELAEDAPVEPSPLTVHRMLHKHGFHSQITMKKPFINCANQAKQLTFAQKH